MGTLIILTFLTAVQLIGFLLWFILFMVLMTSLIMGTAIFSIQEHKQWLQDFDTIYNDVKDKTFEEIINNPELTQSFNGLALYQWRLYCKRERKEKNVK